MGNSYSSVPNACPRRTERRRPYGRRRNSAFGGFGVAQQMVTHTHTYRNPRRKHFPPDRQGTPRKDKRPVVSSQQRYRRHKSAAPACSGCGRGPPDDDRRMYNACGRTSYKCQKLNDFANVCKANIQQTHLVENDTHRASICECLSQQSAAQLG